MISATQPQQPGDWFADNPPPPAPAATPSPTPNTVIPAAAPGTPGFFQPPSSMAPPPAAGGGPGGVYGNSEAARDAWLASGGKTNADFKAFVAAHPEFGWKVGGSTGDKAYGPNGEFWADAVIAGHEGGRGGSWQTGTGGGSGGGGADFGSFAQGFGKEFHAPTIEEMRNMPGYQFALNQGIDALDKRAAARGTHLGGGQKKDVMEFAIGLADQSAQTKYQNSLGEYMNSYNIFRNDKNDIFGRYDKLADRGTSAAQAATS